MERPSSIVLHAWQQAMLSLVAPVAANDRARLSRTHRKLVSLGGSRVKKAARCVCGGRGAQISRRAALIVQ
jgi:hypothetical protein